jgi:hypothetical protein
MQNEIKNSSEKVQTPIEELLFKKEMSNKQKNNYFWKDYNQNYYLILSFNTLKKIKN